MVWWVGWLWGLGMSSRVAQIVAEVERLDGREADLQRRDVDLQRELEVVQRELEAVQRELEAVRQDRKGCIERLCVYAVELGDRRASSADDGVVGFDPDMVLGGATPTGIVMGFGGQNNERQVFRRLARKAGVRPLEGREAYTVAECVAIAEYARLHPNETRLESRGQLLALLGVGEGYCGEVRCGADGGVI